MIRRQDILDRAAEWGLRPDVVEKDYVLGWMLAGIGSHPIAGGLWVFKGGTCIKKCYVETYRFSEDLDFTLLPECPYTADELGQILNEIARSVGDQSGIEFPAEGTEIRERKDKLGRPTFQARVSYRGPLAFPTAPRVLFDLTKHEPVLDAESRPVLHAYPDSLPDGSVISAYSLNELLSEKVRALCERTRPRDLYDVVYLLENQAEAFDLGRVRELFLSKCEAKGLEAPSSNGVILLVQSSDELRADWANMLSHQLPYLPSLDDFLHRLPGLIHWLDETGEAIPKAELQAVPISATGEVVTAPRGIQYWGGSSSIEAVRFSAANRLLVEFNYNGRRRRIEPYSLRRAPTTGNLLLYAWEEAGTHIKAFNAARMTDVRPTSSPFIPRYRIDLTPSGAFDVPPARAGARRSSTSTDRTPRRTANRRSSGPHYVFECAYCRKAFRHSRNNPTLGKHKAKGGNWTCPGRRGYLVRIT